MAKELEIQRFTQVRYVFLDRDGVINKKPREGEYTAFWRDFHILEGVEEAIAHLNRTGRTVLVVSNQRGVALGLYTESDVRLLHARLEEHLQVRGAHIDAYYYCPHDKNQCQCRKPGTGLFEQAYLDFPEAGFRNSVMIGDSLSDMEAGLALQMPAIFIEGEAEYQKPGAERAAAMASATAASLSDAVRRFLP